MRVGTNNYRQYEESIASERRKHVASLVEFGVIPKDLGASAKTEFVYVAHCPTIPANREELDKLLGVRAVKACEGLHYSDEDEKIREQLEGDYPNAK